MKIKPPRVGNTVHYHFQGDQNPIVAFITSVYEPKANPGEFTVDLTFLAGGSTLRKWSAVRHRDSQHLKNKPGAKAVDGYWVHIDTPELDECQSRILALEQQVAELLVEVHRLKKHARIKDDDKLPQKEAA
jgi:hypothetical protein